MSDFQRKIQKFLLAPSDVFVAGDGLTGQGREIAETIAMAKAKAQDPLEYAQAWQYVCTQALTLPINLANIQLLVDVHPCLNVFTLDHFIWHNELPGTARPIWHTFHQNDQQYSFLGMEGIQIRKHEAFVGVRQESASFYALAVRSHGVDEEAFDSLDSIKKAYANYCLFRPFNEYREYHEWIKQGYKPSQFGLLPPEDVQNLTKDIWTFSEYDQPLALSKAPVPAFQVALRPAYADLADDFAQLNNGTIAFTLDLNHKESSTDGFKEYLQGLWETQERQKHPLRMTDPPSSGVGSLSRLTRHENRFSGP